MDYFIFNTMDEECPVCLENRGGIEGLCRFQSCSHRLCYLCYNSLEKKRGPTLCPLCQRPLRSIGYPTIPKAIELFDQGDPAILQLIRDQSGDDYYQRVMYNILTMPF